MRKRLIAAPVLIFALVAGGAAGYAGLEAWNRAPGASADPALVEQLQNFDTYPVYWPGPAVVDPSGRRHDLVHVDWRDIPAADDGHRPRSRLVSLIYGTCTPSSGSCPVPVTMYVEPTCDQPIERLYKAAKVGDPVPFRGATAQRSRNGLLVYANGVTVSIFTAIKGSKEDNYQFQLSIAGALRGINAKGIARVPTAGGDLGAYDPAARCP